MIKYMTFIESVSFLKSLVFIQHHWSHSVHHSYHLSQCLHNSHLLCHSHCSHSHVHWKTFPNSSSSPFWPWNILQFISLSYLLLSQHDSADYAGHAKSNWYIFPMSSFSLFSELHKYPPWIWVLNMCMY
jgi:hypothetical protein